MNTPSRWLVTLSCLAVSCADEHLIACTEEARPAITVEIRDSVSLAPAATGAVAIARDGPYADTLRAFSTLSASGAYERPGTYTVTVAKSGYQDWTATGVRAADLGCHVETVILQTRLKQP